MECRREKGVLSLLPTLFPEALDASLSWVPHNKAGLRRQVFLAAELSSGLGTMQYLEIKDFSLNRW